MSSTNSRPLSPHLGIYRWSWAMRVSILHRATGIALTVGGLAALTWWLCALAAGPEQYATFLNVANSWFGVVVLVGLTWSFFQHLFSGLRHLVLDMGAGYELKVNRFWSIMTVVGSVFCTALTWAWFSGMLPHVMGGR